MKKTRYVTEQDVMWDYIDIIELLYKLDVIDDELCERAWDLI